MTDWTLKKLDRPLKLMVLFFTLVLTFGFITGLIYLSTTSGIKPDTVLERYNGSNDVYGVDEDDDFDIPDHFPKPVADLLVTTHGHVIQFALIYFLIGGLFFFNSRIRGWLRTFLILEPFVSTLVTFAGLWIMRFLSPEFVYLVMLSSILMYICYFIMTTIIILDCFSSSD